MMLIRLHRFGLLTAMVLMAIVVCFISQRLFADESSEIERPHVLFAFQDTDNYPFQVGDGTDIPEKLPGIAVEQIQDVARRLNLDLELIRVPWKRGLVMLESGRVDGLFSASFQQARLKYGRYPFKGMKENSDLRSYSNSYSLFVHKDSDIDWDGITFSHRGFRVFVPLGFSIAKDLKKQGLLVNESSDVLPFLKMLSKNRIDAVALLTPSGQSYLNKNRDVLRSVKMLPKPLVNKDYYLMLSHQFVANNEALAELIWETVVAVRDDPEFMERYSLY
jgi:polar amino acid transport system substrate-binding protein